MGLLTKFEVNLDEKVAMTINLQLVVWVATNDFGPTGLARQTDRQANHLNRSEMGI